MKLIKSRIHLIQIIAYVQSTWFKYNSVLRANMLHNQHYNHCSMGKFQYGKPPKYIQKVHIEVSIVKASDKLRGINLLIKKTALSRYSLWLTY